MTEDINPYRPPAAIVGDVPGIAGQRELAGKGRRFGTLVVDYVGYFLLSMAVGAVVGLVFGQRGLEAIDRIPNILLGAVILLAYYAFFEGLWGRTPGKLLFGTMVVDMDGARPAFGRVMQRTLARFIPFEAFTFFGERGLHDKLSKTQVVRAR